MVHSEKWNHIWVDVSRLCALNLNILLIVTHKTFSFLRTHYCTGWWWNSFKKITIFEESSKCRLLWPHLLYIIHLRRSQIHFHLMISCYIFQMSSVSMDGDRVVGARLEKMWGRDNISSLFCLITFGVVLGLWNDTRVIPYPDVATHRVRKVAFSNTQMST